jgi:hypothetical protein
MAQQPREEEQPPLLFVHLLQTIAPSGNLTGAEPKRRRRTFFQSFFFFLKPKSVKQTKKDMFK